MKNLKCTVLEQRFESLKYLAQQTVHKDSKSVIQQIFRHASECNKALDEYDRLQRIMKSESIKDYCKENGVPFEKL